MLRYVINRSPLVSLKRENVRLFLNGDARRRQDSLRSDALGRSRPSSRLEPTRSLSLSAHRRYFHPDVFRHASLALAAEFPDKKLARLAGPACLRRLLPSFSIVFVRWINHSARLDFNKKEKRNSVFSFSLFYLFVYYILLPTALWITATINELKNARPLRY